MNFVHIGCLLDTSYSISSITSRPQIVRSLAPVFGEITRTFEYWCTGGSDGLDDGSIHCLKHGRLAHNAVEAIATETVRFNNTDDSDDDPFTNISEVEFEEDAAVIENE